MSVYSINPNLLPAQGIPSGYSGYGTIVIFGKPEYKVMYYVDVFGQFAIYNGNALAWVAYNKNYVLGEGNHGFKIGYDDNVYVLIDGVKKFYVQEKV